jgi:hypothetical protein
MSPNQSTDDSKNLNVIWFWKVHDDTIDIKSYERTSETSRCIFKVEAKRRPGVVLGDSPGNEMKYCHIWCLTSLKENDSIRLGIVNGLNRRQDRPSFLRNYAWEVIWVPENLLEKTRTTPLSREQTKTVLDAWRQMMGYAPNPT